MDRKHCAVLKPWKTIKKIWWCALKCPAAIKVPHISCAIIFLCHSGVWYHECCQVFRMCVILKTTSWGGSHRECCVFQCGVISPRFDVALRDLESWTNRLLPSRQFGLVHCTCNFNNMVILISSCTISDAKMGSFLWVIVGVAVCANHKLLFSFLRIFSDYVISNILAANRLQYSTGYIIMTNYFRKVTGIDFFTIGPTGIFRPLFIEVKAA